VHGCGNQPGNRELERRRSARAERGTRLLQGGSMPRPTGGSPPGAALPPVGSPASAGSRYMLQRAAGDRASASWPGPPSTCRACCRVKGHGDHAGTPRIVRGGPSSVKGTRRSFLTTPQKGSSGPALERRSLCAAPTGRAARARPEARPYERAARPWHLSGGRRRSRLTAGTSLHRTNERLPKVVSRRM
jgi:hypothetical protein